MARVGETKRRIKPVEVRVTLTQGVVDELDDLVQTGLHGADREALAAALVGEALRARLRAERGSSVSFRGARFTLGK